LVWRLNGLCRVWRSTEKSQHAALEKRWQIKRSSALSGTADAAMRFQDVCALLERLGFQVRVKGSHHIFRKEGIEEKLNLQREGQHAKPYQVKQVRAILIKYRLGEFR
jgi:hypothetical protein